MPPAIQFLLLLPLPHLLSASPLVPRYPFMRTVAPPSPPLLPRASALPPSPLAPGSSLQPRPNAPPLPLPHTLALPALSTPAPATTTTHPQMLLFELIPSLSSLPIHSPALSSAHSLSLPSSSPSSLAFHSFLSLCLTLLYPQSRDSLRVFVSPVQAGSLPSAQEGAVRVALVLLRHFLVRRRPAPEVASSQAGSQEQPQQVSRESSGVQLNNGGEARMSGGEEERE
ncbi:unnamed protein product [Closterium sp. NIES-65]|nr:unnamed protein product [Closterium sp. NIES-65]